MDVPTGLWILGGVVLLIVVVVAAMKAFGGSSASDMSNAAPVGTTGGGSDVDLSAVPQRFVILDLETTGLDPTRHEIVEIGAIRVNDIHSNFHDTFQALVKTQRPISKRATRINGITQKMVDKEGEPLETVLRDFAEFIGDLPLVSFNFSMPNSTWDSFGMLQQGTVS